MFDLYLIIKGDVHVSYKYTPHRFGQIVCVNIKLEW